MSLTFCVFFLFILILMLINILSSVIFRKIIIIFSFGLLFRILIGHTLDTDVIKEYIDFIYFGYLGGTVLFSISSDAFNISLVSEALSAFIFGNDNYMMDHNYINNNLHSMSTNGENKNFLYLSSGRQGPSAASNYVDYRDKDKIYKLGFGAPSESLYKDLPASNVHWSVKDSLITRVKCKSKWYLWIKYNDKFNSYQDYKRFFINNRK